MTDPTFKDRAGLEAWEKAGLIDTAWSSAEWPLVLARIKRVRAAHAHLIEETPHGRD